MNRRRIAVAAVVLLALGGCGGLHAGKSAAPSLMSRVDSEQTAPSESSAAQTEGPVSAGRHEWADGITAEVTAVEAAPAEAPDIPAFDAEVRVTTVFTNASAETVALPATINTLDSGPPDHLLYGVDRQPALSEFNEENTLPTQLAAGSSAEWVSVFTLPGSELQELIFVIAPTQEHYRYTFTEVETLLR